MFVRKKPNKSGLVSIQVIEKRSGRYKVVKTIGSSKDDNAIDKLVRQGEEFIKSKKGYLELPFNSEKQDVLKVLDNIQSITVSGTELLLGKIFNEIGFNTIGDELFKWLVFSRLCFPSSKLKTTEYLFQFHGVSIEVHALYRYMDKLNADYKESVQWISFKHTRKVLGGTINIVFYDVTTLYFEIDQEDELRKNGFSKDGKHQNPQIVLGLLVGLDGYPQTYG